MSTFNFLAIGRLLWASTKDIILHATLRYSTWLATRLTLLGVSVLHMFVLGKRRPLQITPSDLTVISLGADPFVNPECPTNLLGRLARQVQLLGKSHLLLFRFRPFLRFQLLVPPPILDRI